MVVRASVLGRLTCLGLMALCCVSEGVLATEEEQPAKEEKEDLTKLDLATLMQMDVEVTSVSKKETRLGDAATAIAVITPDDLRRLGITSIAEALRLVPGVHVARVTANKWAITARGFNSEYASKLLVLVDGRSVYTPNQAGVSWDDQDVMLEDLARIEVIRGPGATLWGANAVNGVVNVITKNARDSQGLLFSSSFGSEEQPSAGIRYGGTSGNDLHYRVYARYFDRDHFEDSNGVDTADAWRSVRGGFRLDWEPPGADQLTLQGDLYSNDVGLFWTNPVLTPPSNVDQELTAENRGGNLLARWSRQYSEDASSELQIYYDRFRHVNFGAVETRETGDIDWQHRFKLGGRQDLTWGLGYRVSSDDIPPLSYFFYTPRGRTLSLYSAFVQDEIALYQGRLRLTLGSKFEHNDYTGFEVQPSARALFKFTDTQAIWASVARAVRLPARFDHDARADQVLLSENPPVVLTFFGNPNLDVETVIAYELGLRSQLTPTLTADIATFYDVYQGVLNFEAGAPVFEPTPAPGHLVIPLLGAGASDKTYGAEVALQWTPVPRWKLNAGYSLLHMQLASTTVGLSPGDSPRNQFQLRSYLNLPRDFELNGAVFYVDSLPNQGVSAYTRLDLGVVWRAGPTLELGVWGRNLLDAGHREFASLTSSIRTEIPRTVLGRMVWSFQ